MSSILTNTGAMTALQTMRNINRGMETVQGQISTGLKVGSAKDNSATWAISKVMESDVAGFKAIKENLALGSSTVNVARNAAETTTKLLTEIKEKVVQAQEANVDRDKIQADIEQLRGQISSVISSAQFNGLNLVDGSSSDPVDILASLDRSGSGTVSSSSIEVSRQNLSVSEPVTAASFGGTAPADQATANAFMGTGGAYNTVFDGTDPLLAANNPETQGDGAAAFTFEIGQVTEGASYRVSIGDVMVNVVGGGETPGTRTFEYVASATDGTEDVARNLFNQISAFFGAATDSARGYNVTLNGSEISISHEHTDNDPAVTNPDLEIGLGVMLNGTPGASASTGGLGALQTLNVTTDSDAAGALATIDGLINQSIEAAAAFGQVQKRLEIQEEFVGNLMDSLRAGIGSLVDADMEEASARLQALQVQQQLGIQSLTIANQQPQNILSLFR